MGAAKRLATFIGGGLAGAAAGALAGLLFAPQSGDELREKVDERLRQARLAGTTAQAAKEEELIRKFRAEVNDPDALREEEMQARTEVATAVQAIGLTLNAPGAIAAQETFGRGTTYPPRGE
ncbi:MAG TPA: YtxH domain-containing protein [Thermomicrobiales bacterium]